MESVVRCAPLLLELDCLYRHGGTVVSWEFYMERTTRKCCRMDCVSRLGCVEPHEQAAFSWNELMQVVSI